MYTKKEIENMIEQRKKEIMQKIEEQKNNANERINTNNKLEPISRIETPIDPEVQAEIDEYEKNGPCKSCQGLR